MSSRGVDGISQSLSRQELSIREQFWYRRGGFNRNCRLKYVVLFGGS